MSDEQLNLFGGLVATPGVSENKSAGKDLIPTSAAIPIAPGTYGSIDELAAHCGVCQRCVLGSTRLNPVVGRGAITAPVMIVGEGPGQNVRARPAATSAPATRCA